LRGLDRPEVDRDDLLAKLREVAPKVLPYADRVAIARSRPARRHAHLCSKGRRGDADGRSRHLPLRDFVEHGWQPGRGWCRIAPAAIGFVLRITKAVHDTGRPRAVPDRLTDTVGQTLGDRGTRIGVVTAGGALVAWSMR